MKWKTAVIGAGGISHCHAKALLELGVTISGVYDVNRTNAKKFAELYGSRVFDNWEDMLDSVDMVHLFTPPSKRIEYVRAAAKAKKHLFIEKPIAIAMSDAEEMARLAQENNKVLEGLCVIESRQGKGTFICTDLKEDSFNALTFQMLVLPRSTGALLGFRKMFETAYTFMAMETATEEDLDRLEAIVATLEEKTKTRPVEKQDEMDFHLGVLKCTHNLYVMRVGETMLELFLSTIQKQPVRSEKYNVPVDHRRMYQALREKDRESLQRELELSFRGWTDQYLRD